MNHSYQVLRGQWCSLWKMETSLSRQKPLSFCTTINRPAENMWNIQTRQWPDEFINRHPVLQGSRFFTWDKSCLILLLLDLFAFDLLPANLGWMYGWPAMGSPAAWFCRSVLPCQYMSQRWFGSKASTASETYPHMPVSFYIKEPLPQICVLWNSSYRNLCWEAVVQFAFEIQG